MFTVLAAAPTTTINWGSLLNTTVGIMFSLVIGFFVLEFILGALNLATAYNDPKAMETAKNTFTAAIKGLVISPYTSAKVITNGEKLILEPNTFLRVVSDTVDSIDAVVSYVEIV